VTWTRAPFSSAIRSAADRWVAPIDASPGRSAVEVATVTAYLLGCYGAGKVRKFAEIYAGVVLAGDVSLTAAILAGDWVTSHDALGRNRP
jgi:Hydroxymethylglutaryl-coenzyme A reductase